MPGSFSCGNTEPSLSVTWNAVPITVTLSTTDGGPAKAGAASPTSGAKRVSLTAPRTPTTPMPPAERFPRPRRR